MIEFGIATDPCLILLLLFGDEGGGLRVGACGCGLRSVVFFLYSMVCFLDNNWYTLNCYFLS